MDIDREAEFYCELVSCGIGGRTIAEARRNLSNSEIQIWRAYRKKYGSLFFGRRIEQAIGNWMAHYTRFKVKEGSKVDARDFMPHEEKLEIPEMSLEEYMMRSFGGS